MNGPKAPNWPWGTVNGWQGEYHEGVRDLVRDLNGVYASSGALHTQDFTGEGFSWNKGDDATNNVLSFLRYGTDGSRMMCVFNLSGTPQPSYSLGVPERGVWELVLNTDAASYQGAGNNIGTSLAATDSGRDGYPRSVTVHAPAMSAQFYLWRG
jgi:1,4-alpha-glucan branching enzyme